MRTTLSRPSGDPASTTVPDATRARRPGWREPRLWLGLAMVAACVLVGARVMAGADDTVPVWATTRGLTAGTALQADDLERHQVHFADGDDAGRYLTGELPAGGLTVTRDLGPGELVPRAALGDARRNALVQVPLGVQSDDVPATVRRGSVVDVWVAPTQPGDRARARRVLDDVVVVAAPRDGSALSPRSSRQVIIGVPEDAAARLGDAIGAITTGRVVLTVAGR
jgi:hypothetical protein